ncbi:MAG: tetratricopeptide repeat protein [Planctomycetota bacterium]|nr:tetratricopeptide repeat protein [Planctomycetota bacterium]
MTLNITVVTRRHIYQSSDCRSTNWETGSYADSDVQKIFPVGGQYWDAVVCFCGVAMTGPITNVGNWLSRRISLLSFDSSFSQFIDQLLEADVWLSSVEEKYRRHSFTVGAFVNGVSRCVLVSNFERINDLALKKPAQKLFVTEADNCVDRYYVSGRPNSVRKGDLQRMVKLAAKSTSHETIFTALAGINKAASKRDITISPACVTACISADGRSSARPHHVDNVAQFYVPTPGLSSDEFFSLAAPGGRGRIVQTASVRMEMNLEFLQRRLEMNPGSSEAHLNLGRYYQEREKDYIRAEAEYLLAIRCDSRNAFAVSNLAVLAEIRGKFQEARQLYEKALEISPGNEGAIWGLAKRLLVVGEPRESREKSLQLVIAGAEANPDSSRLQLLAAELFLEFRTPSKATEFAERARRAGAEQDVVEVMVAIAKQLSGASVVECIGAYRLAIAMAPKEPSIRLNIAQLLFVTGDSKEAATQLRTASEIGLGPSSALEMEFYQLAHLGYDCNETIKRMKQLVAAGGVLNWDVSCNIEVIRRVDQARAAFLERVKRVIEGHGGFEGIVQ